MAFEIIDTNEFPGIAASNCGDKMVVTLTTGGERAVCPVIAATTEPHGITIATALRTEGVTVIGQGNYAKAIAAASLGVGANVGILGATRSLGLVSTASGTANWRVGKSVTAAAAGEVFTLYVNPSQLGGLA